MSGSKDELEKANFFYTYAMNISTLIAQRRSTLYNKIKDITTIITALIPILFGLGYYSLDNPKFDFVLFPIGLTLTCFFIAVLIGFYVLLEMEFAYNDPLQLIEKYHEESLKFITLITASSVASLANFNSDAHNKLGEGFQIMVYFVGAGFFIILVTFWMAVWCTLGI